MRYVSHIICVIRGFKDCQTKLFFETGKPGRSWAAIANVAARNLDYLDSTRILRNLNAPPGNRLEALKSDR